MTNLVDLLAGAMGPEVASVVSRVAGVGQPAVSSAASALAPALVGALAQRAGGADGAASLFSALTGSQLDNLSLSSLAALPTGTPATSFIQAGTQLLTSLFGADRTNGLANAIGEVSGLGSTNGRNVIMMLAPLALTALKKYVLGNNLNASGLAQLLRGQGRHLEGRLDNRLLAAIGLGAPGALSNLGATAAAAAAPVAHTVQTAAPVVAKTGGGLMRWLPWIIGALLLAWLLSRCAGTPATPPAPAPEPTPQVTAPAPTPAPAPAPAASETAAAPAPAAAAMPQNVYYETGSSTIGPKGEEAIKAVVTWLKEDGARKVGVTGYTDKQGDAAANEKLAKDRAQGVKAALEKEGVAADRIQMEKPMFVEIGAGVKDEDARRVEMNAR